MVQDEQVRQDGTASSATESSAGPHPATLERHPQLPEAKTWWGRLLKNPWFLAAIGGVVTLTVIRPFLRHVPEPPPILMELPAWELVDQDGQVFGSADLAGEVYLVNFFFTSCPSICPPLMQAMLALQDRFDANKVDVRLVSVSVDPENDVPAALKEYGAKLGSDFERWTYVTGDEQKVRALVVDGFKLHLGEKELNENNVIDIAHVGKIILVDDQGRVRGLYDTDDLGMDEAFHRAKRVAELRE